MFVGQFVVGILIGTPVLEYIGMKINKTFFKNK
jgi:hypothetical protein